MNTINRYIDNQRAYVVKKKAQPLFGFTNAQGEPASWRDIAVTFTDSDNKPLNILFCNQNRKASNIGTRFTNNDRLAPEIHDLLFSYMLDVIKENITIQNKKAKITAARVFLGLLKENVATTSIENIQHTIDSMTSKACLISFFGWLHHHKMLPQNCRPYINDLIQ